MEFQDYFVLEVYDRKKPSKVLDRYFYDTVREARADFNRRKGRINLSRLVLETCQGQLIDIWERKE